MKNKNICLIVIFITFLTPFPSFARREMTYDEKKTEFGTETPSVISNGFVFFMGRYIEAPYAIKREGLAILINDVKVYELYAPTTDPLVDPPMPDTINENSTFEEIRKYLQKKIRYIIENYPGVIVTQKRIELLLSLPCVESVTTLSPKYSNTLVITYKNGKQVRVYNGLPWPKDYETREDYLKSVEVEKKYYEKYLKENTALFIYAKNIYSPMASRSVKKKLRLMVETLRSSKPLGQKKLILQKMSRLPTSEASIQQYYPLLTNFYASSQLDERLSALIEQDKITPVTEQDLPEEIPVLKHERIMEEKVREAQQSY